ncbi:hypothetical protein GJ633_06855 [Halorubrum sp. CBA1125]|uniref:hypothetical protein n=1 Tax=Halorubrum sp. CBA1125 TaxID=2668072 RepID=UPI0012E7336C|nr:hypothetical protein [Halorubrum sp. CBA1125]MUW14416.1 hypothetical protein [Halorubrum sp. CBA1125]
MSLRVEPSDPPELQSIDPNQYDDAEVVGDTDYKRDELEAFLKDGAWEEAFERWAADTDMDEREYEIVRDLGLIQRFDFFWDSFAERVGYHAPGLPEDWKERDIHPDLDSWESVSSINAGLTELGQIVCDVLKDEYIDWETEYEAPDDLPDFET